MARRAGHDTNPLLSQSTPALPRGPVVTEYERAYVARHALGPDRAGGVQSEEDRRAALESTSCYPSERLKDKPAVPWNISTNPVKRTPRKRRPYSHSSHSQNRSEEVERPATDESVCLQWESWAAEIEKSADEHNTKLLQPPELPSSTSRLSKFVIRIAQASISAFTVVHEEVDRLHTVIRQVEQSMSEELAKAGQAAEASRLAEEKFNEAEAGSSGRRKGGGRKEGSPERNAGKGKNGQPRSPKAAGDSEAWYRRQEYTDPNKRLSLFSWLDKGGEQKITREEFVTAMRTGVIAPAAPKPDKAGKRKSLFSKMDKDHDDTISRQEFVDAMHAGVISAEEVDEKALKLELEAEEKAEKLENEVEELVRVLGGPPKK